jgi:hypothetical protein
MLCVSLACVPGMAADVPAVLPRPDKTAPSAGKVKVYILAGQSNMVGFGYLQGARPVYPSIYLSADPNIKVGRMPVGPSALLGHGVYQTADRDAPEGAKVAIYPGAYKAGTDYSAMKPVKEASVALGDVAAQLPAIKKPHTVVARAFIDVPTPWSTWRATKSTARSPTRTRLSPPFPLHRESAIRSPSPT